MKKIMYICLSLLLFLTPFNVYADEYKIEFHSTDSTYGEINYYENPAILTLRIKGIERTVYVEPLETYYYDDFNNKVILISVKDGEESNDNQAVTMRAVSLNSFLNDFYYKNSFVPKEFRISEGLQTDLAGLTKAIATQALTYLGLPKSLSSYITSSVEAIARAIQVYPPDYAIKLNIKYYRNKNCSTYLGGQTFNMVANGKTTPTMYSYTWEENPSLGVVSQACKLQSNTYTYQYGIGQ